MKDTEKLKTELANLRNSFQEIASIWSDQSIEVSIMLNEVLDKGYPFKTSFDELNLEVRNWADNAINEIEQTKVLDKLYLSAVTLNESQNFECYLLPNDHWNGWLCPYMNRKQVEKFINWLNSLEAELISSMYQFYFDEKEPTKLCYVDPFDGDDEVYTVPLSTDDELYDMSLGLCWEPAN